MRAKKGTLLVCTLLAALPSPASSSAQATQIDVATTASCQRCRIELRPVAAVHDTSGRAELRHESIVVPLGTKGFVAHRLFEEGILAAFDADGRLMETFGRKGDGPGEFRNTANPGLFVGEDDSIHVVDQRRRTVLAPFPMEFVRSHPLASYASSILLADGSVLSTLRSGGYVVYSSEGEPGRRHVAVPAPMGMFASRSGNDRIWMIVNEAYRLLRIDVETSSVLTRIEGDLQRLVEEGSRTPARPFVNTTYEDSTRLLWVTIMVPDPMAEPPATPAELQNLNLNRQFDTVVHVIDLESGLLVAEERFPQALRFVGFDGVLQSTSENEHGSVIAMFWRAALNRSSSSTTTGG